MILRALCIAAVLSVAIVAEAGACSCAAAPAEQRLASSDVGFVGTVIDRESGPGQGVTTYALRVEKVYKGRVGERVKVRLGNDDGMCGYRAKDGERLGFVLDGEGPWSAGICSMISEEDLERATATPAPPPGSGRAALLASGTFGANASVLALDDAGSPIAYGFGRGGSSVSLCPGAGRLVQVGLDELTVRRVRDLKVLSRRRLPSDSWTGRCLDRLGRDVVVARAFDSTARKRPGIVRLRGSRTTVIARGSQPYVAFGENEVVFISGIEGDVRIKASDYSGARRRVVTRHPELPGSMALRPGGTHLAYFAFDYSEPSKGIPARLIVVDLRSGTLVSEPIDERDAGGLEWLDADRLLVVAREKDRPSRIVDPALADLATMSSAGLYPGTVLGGDLWSVDSDGILRRARPPGEEARRVALLLGEQLGLIALPSRPAIRATRRLPARRTSARAARVQPFVCHAGD